MEVRFLELACFAVASPQNSPRLWKSSRTTQPKNYLILRTSSNSGDSLIALQRSFSGTHIHHTRVTLSAWPLKCLLQILLLFRSIFFHSIYFLIQYYLFLADAVSLQCVRFLLSFLSHLIGSYRAGRDPCSLLPWISQYISSGPATRNIIWA